MPNADVSEKRIVISECGQRSTDWWNTLLDKLKAHHIPGRYQDGKRMWADSRGNAIIYSHPIRYRPMTRLKCWKSVDLTFVMAEGTASSRQPWLCYFCALRRQHGYCGFAAEGTTCTDGES